MRLKNNDVTTDFNKDVRLNDKKRDNRLQSIDSNTDVRMKNNDVNIDSNTDIRLKDNYVTTDSSQQTPIRTSG